VAHVVGQSATTYIALDTTRPPFTQGAVRRAVGLALDRRVTGRAAGDSRATARMIPPGTPGHRGTIPAPDVSRARSLIAGAGATGTPVVIWTGPSASERVTARAARDAMRAAGLAPTVRELPRDGGIGSDVPRAVVASATWSQSVPDGADAYAALLGGPSPGTPGDPPIPRITGAPDLRAQARAAASLPLGAPRAAQWAQVDARAVADGRVLPVLTPRTFHVTARGVRGFTMHPVLGVLLAPMRPPA
jgi:ABC-type transport system substrate-binding protein